MKVLVFPRSPNPYQDDLYGAMRDVAPIGSPLITRPLGELTPSQTLNILTLPLALAAERARGCRVLHVHWVYPFGLVWARSRWARRVMRAWFHVVLLTASALGFAIVWTAHNLVPHEPVFDDDAAARRVLVRRSHTVIAHSAAVAEVVRGWGARRVVVIPPGLEAPTYTPDRQAACRRLGLDPARFRVLHFGVVREYKGVDTLLAAAGLEPLASATDIELVVVGACPDPALGARLAALAAEVGDTRVRFEHVAADVLDAYLAASDVAVFPFRAITSSSSVGRALGAGVPVVVPDLANLAEVPAGACVRYDPDGGPAALAGAIAHLAGPGRDELRTMAQVAQRVASAWTWPDAAARTWRACSTT